MIKKELVRKIVENIDGATIKDVTVVVDELFDVITQTVASGEEVKITGFGAFERGERSARTGRDPRNGNVIQIPASKTPKFKAGSAFKAAVNN